MKIFLRLDVLVFERMIQVASTVMSGDTVAVMDWGSHRNLECYFAIPKR
jgi:hypothetical protein